MRSIVQNTYFQDNIYKKTNPVVTAWFFDAYVKNLSAAPIVREAAALAAFWENATLSIYPQELLVGGFFATEVAGFHYSDGVWVNEQRLDTYITANHLDPSLIKSQAEAIQKLVYHNPTQDYFDPSLYAKTELASIASTAASSTWFGGHLAMDYETVLTHGLKIYHSQIAAAKQQNPHNQPYYTGLTLILNGFQALIHRTAVQCNALAQAQTDATLKNNMEQAAAALFYVEQEPPTSFYQALQLVTIMHIATDADSFGRFDSYLRPFFEADIQKGVLTLDTALDLLQSLVIKVEQQEQIQNLTLGGILPDGSPNYTDLTRLMLQATKAMGYKGPNLCLRVHPDMPPVFWEHITDCMESGQGLPALYNDTAVLATLADYPLPLARDYCLGGCSQIMFGGRCQFVNDIGLMNIAKIVELTLHNGKDFLRQQQVSIKTGEPTAFTCFADFYAAFCKQLDYFVSLESSINNKDILDRGAKEGYALRSLFTRGCIASGKGVFQGGALYNHVQLECIGVTNGADSLYAIQKLVFEDARLSLTDLVTALDADFVGYEPLRLQLRAVTKFGNNFDPVDQIRVDITKRLYTALRQQAGAFGGHYIPGEVIFTAHEPCGHNVAATPDGRRQREVLADSAGSSQGMDLLGPTALMNSVLKIPLEGMITSVVLNMKFQRNFFAKNTQNIAALFQGYFAAGGQQLQINVCDNAVLRLALLEPEKYQNLVVRVGGYSDYFVRLSPRLQQEILLRSSSVM